MLIKSLLTTENSFNSTQELKDWIKQRNEDVSVEVDLIPFKEMKKWHQDADLSLHHDSGKFFSIQGITVDTDYGHVSHWEQPIIVQPEIGYLGILCKEFHGVLYFLMQAKIEPGNVNCVQISPTLQATKSNYKRVHHGKKPNYLDYFVNATPDQIVLDQLQSEQGARFLRKRNRNIIIKVDDDVEVLPDFRWMTLGQIKEFMQYDNMVNMDTRTVLSGLKLSRYQTPISDLRGISPLGKDLLLSSSTNHSVYHMSQHLSWLANLKATYDLFVDKMPLSKVEGWEVRDNEIARPDKKYFRVIGAHVKISNREIAEWYQPLVQPMQRGICAFIIKKIHGIYHFLIQAKLECGNFDVMELAPTVQCLTGDYSNTIKNIPFLEYVLNARKEQVIIDTLQSEEGGRFFHEQNRNMVIIADDNFPIELPDNYTWMTMNQMFKFLDFNNYLNIQARSLIAQLKYNL
jgi:oxidase EvaA